MEAVPRTPAEGVHRTLAEGVHRTLGEEVLRTLAARHTHLVVGDIRTLEDYKPWKWFPFLHTKLREQI